ncbi:LAFA_0G18690g1_1 [Lachancea sp. 'fantastica']|nr:LAFA_0G18690g1_1 [Lachancea sp. 'fantastica']
MPVSDVSLLVILTLSFALSFHVSREIFWFKAQLLFEPGDGVMGEQIAGLNVLKEHEKTFLNKLYNPFSLSSQRVTRYIRVLFATTCALCVVSVELTLWEIVKAENESPLESTDLASAVWLFASTLLALILILIQPYLILSSVLSKFYGDKLNHSSLTLVCCGIILTWVFTLNGLNVGPFRSSISLLTKISIMGVSVMAMLSGVACISTPYYSVVFFWRKRKGGSSGVSAGRLPSSHYTPVFFLDAAALEAKKHECEAQIQDSLAVLHRLEKEPVPPPLALRQQLFDRTSYYQLELARLQKLASEPRTRHLLKRAFHLGFLAYCIYKLISIFLCRVPTLWIHSIRHPEDYEYEKLMKHNSGESIAGDPLAVSLAKICDFLIFRLKEKTQQESLVKQISLVLSLSLFGCSVTTVVTTISYLTTLLPLRFRILALKSMRQSPRNEPLPTVNPKSFRKGKSEPSIIKNLLISELTGIYVLATILMVRSNLAIGAAQRLNRMLGEKSTVPYIVLDVWFDKIFALSAIMSLIGIKLAERTSEYPRMNSV